MVLLAATAETNVSVESLSFSPDGSTLAGVGAAAPYDPPCR
jgi:hypothetical protein